MRERGARELQDCGVVQGGPEARNLEEKRKCAEIGPSGSGRYARDIGGTGCNAQRGGRGGLMGGGEVGRSRASLSGCGSGRAGV